MPIMILIVEDSECQQNAWRRSIEDKVDDIVDIIPAFTIEQAREMFARYYSEIDIIVLDGCVSGDVLDTLPLATEFRGKFGDGPIIAASSEPKYLGQLITAGCNETCFDKARLVGDIIQVIDKYKLG